MPTLRTCAWLALLLASFGAGTASSQEPAPTATEPDTVIPLLHGAPIVLPGHWTVRGTMWDDAAVVFYDEYAWWSLDGGERAPRRLHAYPDQSWSRASAPAWSHDGSRLFAWLELDRQLTVVGVADGTMRTVSELPTHVWNYERHRHMDPAPVWRDGGVVEDPDNGLLLQLLQEEANEDVAPWQRSAKRSGEHELVAFDVESGSMATVSTMPMPGKVLSWELSLRRQRLYVLDIAQQLVERRLNGKLVRQLDVPAGRSQRIQLSPNEDTLLVECSQAPGIAGLTGDRNGGFVLIDLDAGTLRDGADAGHWAAWAPDGRRVACLQPWELWVHDLPTGESAPVAVRQIPAGGRPNPTYYERPVWSADGRRLVAGLGGSDDNPTLLLDLEAREAFVLATPAKDAVWSREPRPFPAGFVATER